MGYALLDGTCVSSMINKEYTVNGYRFITQFDNGWIAKILTAMIVIGVAALLQINVDIELKSSFTINNKYIF